MIPRILRVFVASFGIERFDGAPKLGQVGADAGVLVDRLDRAVEEAVRRAGGFGDLLAAHRGQLVDLLAEFRAVGIERGELVDELPDALVELARLLGLQRDQPRASAGATGCSASGGSSLSLVAVFGLCLPVRWPWITFLSLPLAARSGLVNGDRRRARGIGLYYRCNTERCKGAASVLVHGINHLLRTVRSP